MTAAVEEIWRRKIYLLKTHDTSHCNPSHHFAAVLRTNKNSRNADQIRRIIYEVFYAIYELLIVIYGPLWAVNSATVRPGTRQGLCSQNNACFAKRGDCMECHGPTINLRRVVKRNRRKNIRWPLNDFLYFKVCVDFCRREKAGASATALALLTDALLNCSAANVYTAGRHLDLSKRTLL